jgi:hypothetical protein
MAPQPHLWFCSSMKPSLVELSVTTFGTLWVKESAEDHLIDALGYNSRYLFPSVSYRLGKRGAFIPKEP